MSQRRGFHIFFCLVLLICLTLGDLGAQKRHTLRDSLSHIALSPSLLEILGLTSPFQIARPPLQIRWMTDSTGKVSFDGSSIRGNLDSLNRMMYLREHSDLQAPAFSQAKDSIIEDFTNGKQMIYYYGDVKATYDNIEMTAAYMEYDLKTKTVFARGEKDSLGNVSGLPKMVEGNNTYEMESVYYNFSTRKARINNMVTQDDQGFLHGTRIKKMEDNSINISKGKYTTCDADCPHFYLKMTNAKVTTGPDGRPGKTIFGPAYVVVEDVPTPLALPFGFVPQRQDRSGGLLMPSYGEEVSRGFYLRDLGYYLVFGDYLDLSLTGDIYTLGSWNVQATSRYKVRYKFNGSFNMNVSKNVTGEKGAADYNESGDFSVRWTHSQDPKARPGTTFSASVNFSSPTNNRYNSQSISQALENQTSSSISYSKTFAGTPFNFSVNLLHSQNSRDSSYALTLPNFTFTMNRIFPFKRKIAVGKKKFYEEISLSYNTAFQNKINFKASEVGDPDFWNKLKSGMQHRFAIGLPSMTVLKYINVSPSVNYGMNWHFASNTKEYNPVTNRVEDKMSDVFSELGVTQDYSFGLSATTKLYGMFVFKKTSKVQAVRHMVTPSLSVSLKPEMGTPANGYVTYNYTDTLGNAKTVEYNKYQGGIYGAPGKGKTASLSFSLGNNLEAKVRSKKDTTDGGIKKVKLIDNLSLSGSYNFLADSMRLSNIGVTMSTSLFGKLSLNGNTTFDPYAVNAQGQRINVLNVVQEGKLARMTNASLSTSYSFQGGNNKKGGTGAYQLVYENPRTGEYIPGGWVYYMDPNIPWSINTNVNYSYMKSYAVANERLQTTHNHTMTLGLSGQLRLTESFNLSLNTGFDMTKFKMTTTQLSAAYDLHCFQISVSWVPNGRWESWSFRIAAKASALADVLQYKKNSSYWDN